MLSVNEIRSSFLAYFAKQGHERVASAPLLPHNDPTLMFVNAGMVPFKDVFTGNESRDYVRAASSQKCVRAGGKHNDLDNVGYTARHHTFFEMLGNFSFGDYFKEEAISFAWELLTKELGLSPDKLYVTIYHTDDEAYNLWKKISGFSDDKIIRISTNDNFWSMGDTGPCGPCSEIFYDHGEDVAGGLPGTPEEDGDRFIEIWNLVFMQYETLADGTRVDLPKPSIDTGMGLERISAVLQNKHDNYDIDLFKHLIDASQSLIGDAAPEHLSGHRVIADHLRSSSFLLADGVMPSNEGRGYVLRRIMRRAMRYAHQLGCADPLMYRLVPALVSEMGAAFPELQRAQSLIEEMLKLEEEKFKLTLGRGLKLLDDESVSLSKGDVLSGEVAFKLYDTYGFPLDLTVDILRGREITVDGAGFESAMAKQKSRARAAWKGSGEQATQEVWFDIQDKHGATEFLGYDNTHAKSKIVALIQDGKPVDTLAEGSTGWVVLNQTPFYGESGGQQGDYGWLRADSTEAKVTDTQKHLGAIHAHQVTVVKGTLLIDAVIEATIDDKRRSQLKANHSATHILHAVLRNQLGDHVTQKGSLVAEDRLRFDISHPKAISVEELQKVEAEVNRIIRQNDAVNTVLMAPDQAVEAGALALFGEKYGEEVRVLSMGQGDDKRFSVELCGGTHVKRLGDIGYFKIISETAIAAGVRRIEAVTGEDAIAYTQKQEQQLKAVASRVKTVPDEVETRIQTLLEERKSLERALADAKKQAALGGGSGAKVEKIGDMSLIARYFADTDPKALRGIVNDLIKTIDHGVVAVSSDFDGKASVLVAVTEALSKTLPAPQLIQVAAPIVGAKGGGGKPTMAQTGGSEGDKAEIVLEKIREYLN